MKLAWEMMQYVPDSQSAPVREKQWIQKLLNLNYDLIVHLRYIDQPTFGTIKSGFNMSGVLEKQNSSKSCFNCPAIHEIARGP